MPRVSLLIVQNRRQLLGNGRSSRTVANFDPAPVVKLFTPDAGATWLLTELDPDEPDIALGQREAHEQVGRKRPSQQHPYSNPLG